MQSETKYYVYLHIKLDTGEPFYVGKGFGRRSKSLQFRNKWWKNIVNKHDFDIVMLEENLTEDQAFSQEVYWINRIGRADLDKGPLVNLSNGGESGASGARFKLTLEQREKQSKKKLGPLNHRYGKVSNRAKQLVSSNGIVYSSITEASKAYGLSYSKLYEMLKDDNKNKTDLKYNN